MDFAITTSGTTGTMTFDKATDNNLLNNIYLSLMVRRGSWFQNPEFGSRLHLLTRAKNTARTEALAVEYCREALQWIIDLGRAASIGINAERDRTVDLHRLKVAIQAQKADGDRISFTTFIEVV
jgi:phage gp46-like protein